MSEELLHTRWSDIPATQLNPLLTRQFVHGSQAMFARIELKKGCIVPRHQHANEQISYLTQGALRFLIGDEGNAIEKIVRAGDILILPGNVPHSAEALEDTINFDIFAPPRQDWISGDDAYLR
jgi:quercetin dioxygenase-like cupin family protein